MSNTTNLSLPYIAAGQAQKHVTINESLRRLDTLVQLGVISRNPTYPPAAPVEGDRYIVATGASGLWAGWDNRIAAFVDGGWLSESPRQGWLAHVADKNSVYCFNGGSWVDLMGSLQNVGLLGVNATANATNRLTVNAGATLLNHDGQGHQLKVNKAASAHTASLLLQESFSGRAEIGLTGDNKLHIKTSLDGTNWQEALVVDSANGNTGIGAPAPEARLHLAEGNLLVSRTSGQPFMILDSRTTGPERAALSLRKQGLDRFTISIDGTSGGPGITYYEAKGPNPAHSFYLAGVERLRLGQGGEFSISGDVGHSAKVMTGGAPAGWKGLGDIPFPSYTLATLPAASLGAGRCVYCSNARALLVGGTLQLAGQGTGSLVTSNGSQWMLAGTAIQAQI